MDVKLNSRTTKAKSRNIESQAAHFITIFIVPLVVLLISVCLLTTYITLINSLETKMRDFSFYTKEIDDTLTSASIFLAKTADDNFQLTSIINQQETNNDIPIRELYIRLRENMSYYPSVLYMFASTQDSVYMAASPYNNSKGDLTYGKVKQLIEKTLESGDFDKSWMILAGESESERYFLRIFQFENIYLGACVDVNTFIKLYEDKYKGSVPHEFWSFNKTNEEISFEYSDKDTSYWEPFLKFTSVQRVGGSRISAVCTVNLWGYLLFPFILILLCAVLVFSTYLSRRYLRRQIVDPLTMMAQHMNEIKISHNQSKPLPETLPNYEMSLLSISFNEMISDITRLNKQLLDEQKKQNALEMQCLRLQLNPHFFLNSLNHIYLLSKSKRNEEIQALTISFTRYFRSVFQFDADTISLAEEITRCKNYAEIYKIRCFKNFEVRYNVPEGLNCYLIPHMAIQTFIENSLKYAMEDLNDLVVGVRVWLEKRDSGDMVAIEIVDNGCGFEAHILEQIQEYTVDNNYSIENGHIGIRNLAQRMYYLYGSDKYCIKVDNGENGGSRVRLLVPALLEHSTLFEEEKYDCSYS